ncbi:DUF2147 domain-containing protein [Rhodoblastus acidophilus]|uniref:DUF2147 domain-containing protein n=1 Tax=Candidatus Rhodoblastus alkanivorans TaxID=2954117 RepID=A0ABS9Z197_9HYPH|nr:DUF2147 domain-containing protein [Candidatus Rhodoblastus alkanivorans]MCI4678524.1 DUF2147 domain-containing protein [Candidatus Rhodoblastus alkanivorans]MCI4681388.1 DUF2147 domain-containing protein [Candidatus Rhodoblastus alkanivorans]MDI4642436.1 DUF2147 domain-containing protein [Rhodoblastus acidophilus]
MKRAVALSSVLVLMALGSPAATAAQFPYGVWRVADGSALIRISPCGGGVCGYVAAAPRPAPGEKSAVGKKILLNLRRVGDVWKGRIFNLDNGTLYDGEISQGGDANHLRVQGCVAGGGLCGGETWKRAR